MPGHDDRTVAETPRSAARRAQTQPPERYKLLNLIGEGGMGRVYRAHDNVLGRDVAVKMIEKDVSAGPDATSQIDRFVREARAAARLVHPNIAVVHDVDSDAGFLVMELVEGDSLRDIAAKGALKPALVRAIAEQVLAALDAAHAAGIIHRDIKPSNIMMANGHVKLVDFGVARLVDADATRTGEQVGTPAYMAPEQVRGASVDARTDLYSLGATLYELVTGERMIAFESPSPAALEKVSAACGDDEALAHVIVKCLQADPAARFDAARTALTALRPIKRRPVWPLAVAVLALAGAGAGVYLYTHRTRPEDPRMAAAFTAAQRGENEKSARLLSGYLGEHPKDPDALTLKFLVDWWEGGVVSSIKDRAQDAPLTVAQRAMIDGIDLITRRRESEAVALMAEADREHPNHVEILYALGEAQWHDQHLEEGATSLERAFMLDPRWQMALHHVEEFRLTRGETARLTPIADKLRAVDPANAATLDCKIAVGERRYADAVAGAKAALGKVEQIPELYICLAQTQALAGDLDGGQQTAKKAFDLWPIDYREWGGFAQYAEFFLYRGKLDEYLGFLRDKPSRQRALALLLWKHSTETNETTPAGVGMRMPPLGAATWLLQEKLKGHDVSSVWKDYPELEVRAFGEALWAPDDDTAIAALRHALEVPQKGDMRMLIAHELAARLHAKGEDVTAVCDEILRPRVYINYRAVVLPDCLAWMKK